jgi:hypothetical protein
LENQGSGLDVDGWQRSEIDSIGMIDIDIDININNQNPIVVLPRKVLRNTVGLHVKSR